MSCSFNFISLYNCIFYYVLVNYCRNTSCKIINFRDFLFKLNIHSRRHFFNNKSCTGHKVNSDSKLCKHFTWVYQLFIQHINISLEHLFTYESIINYRTFINTLLIKFINTLLIKCILIKHIILYNTY